MLESINDWARDLLTNWHFWLVIALFSIGSAINDVASAIRTLSRLRRRGDR